jgi:type II secretory pathway pseudopilin PulG
MGDPERGFGVVEAMVAVTILAIALLLSIQPLMASLNRLDGSQNLSAAEKLAQSEIEAIQALDYDDVGLPGFTPSGVLAPTRTVEVGGQQHTIEIEVRYAGSLTGLDVVPGGGDGVSGVWDPGVNYKVVTVSVTPLAPGAEPVVMDAIIAPSRIGALDGTASVKVIIAPHEPFAASDLQLPSLKLRKSPLPDIRSGTHDTTQVFPAIAVGTWTVLTDDAAGWAIHPDDILAARNLVEARVGTVGTAAFRVYRPASLQVTVEDAVTHQAVPNFTLSLLHVPSGTRTNYTAGVGTVANLVPDAYQVTVAAAGYVTFVSGNINIPANYPEPAHRMTVSLTPVSPPGGTSTTMPAPFTVTFTVFDHTGRVVRGSTVAVVLPSGQTTSGVTNASGQVALNLAAGNCAATAGTAWGHGPATLTFNPATRNQVALWLTRPSGMGAGILSSGERAEFVYRLRRNDAWTALPVNAFGEASFVGLPSNYYVAKRCLANGAIEGERRLSVRANADRFTSVRGWCP